MPDKLEQPSIISEISQKTQMPLEPDAYVTDVLLWRTEAEYPATNW